MTPAGLPPQKERIGNVETIRRSFARFDFSFHDCGHQSIMGDGVRREQQLK